MPHHAGYRALARGARESWATRCSAGRAAGCSGHEGDRSGTAPRVPTLWDAAGDAGLRTAALCWPGAATLGDKVPEFLDQERFEEWPRARFGTPPSVRRFVTAGPVGRGRRPVGVLDQRDVAAMLGLAPPTAEHAPSPPVLCRLG